MSGELCSLRLITPFPNKTRYAIISNASMRYDLDSDRIDDRAATVKERY